MKEESGMIRIFVQSITIIFFALIISGCSDFKESTAGELGKKCFENETCKTGLFCINGICVEELDANTDNDPDNDDSDNGNTGNFQMEEQNTIRNFIFLLKILIKWLSG
jgi:hypothetical protein